MDEASELGGARLMAVGIKTTTTGGKEYTRAISSASLRDNPKILSTGFRKLGLLVQSVAAREKIHPGGRSKPLPRALTSRTGTGRRSIRTDFSRLPGEVSIGSDLKYMAAHEQGGTFSVKAATVAAHTRTKAFGKTFKPFKVPSHTRKAHTLRLPRRAWLEPAVDAVVPARSEEIFARTWEERIGRGS